MSSKSKQGKKELLKEQSLEDMEDIKKSLNFMSMELAKLF